jgi:hypothetical protein
MDHNILIKVGLTKVAQFLPKNIFNQVGYKMLSELLALDVSIYTYCDKIPYFKRIRDVDSIKKISDTDTILIYPPLFVKKLKEFNEQHNVNVWEEIIDNSVRSNLQFTISDRKIYATELFIQYIYSGMPLASKKLKEFITYIFNQPINLESKLSKIYKKRMQPEKYDEELELYIPTKKFTKIKKDSSDGIDFNDFNNFNVNNDINNINDTNTKM